MIVQAVPDRTTRTAQGSSTMDEQTGAAANVDPDAVIPGEAIDKGLDISQVEAAANADPGAPGQGGATDPGGGSASR